MKDNLTKKIRGGLAGLLTLTILPLVACETVNERRVYLTPDAGEAEASVPIAGTTEERHVISDNSVTPVEAAAVPSESAVEGDDETTDSDDATAPDQGTPVSDAAEEAHGETTPSQPSDSPVATNAGWAPFRSVADKLDKLKDVPDNIEGDATEAGDTCRRNYNDGRTPVSLVVKLYENADKSGMFRHYVTSTDSINFGAKYVQVWSGPNYCTGDEVEIRSSNGKFRSGTAGYKGEIASSTITKITIKRNPSCECAEVNRPSPWPHKIRQIVKLYEDEDYEGDVVQIISNTANIDTLDFGDSGLTDFSHDASSARIWKGPHWEVGIGVAFCRNDDFANCEIFGAPKDYDTDSKGQHVRKISKLDHYNLNDNVKSIKILRYR